MSFQTPYSADLGAREPISAMRDAVSRIASLVAGWSAAQYERSYAPGKWTARQVLLHLAQSELAFGMRARMALSVPNYLSQPFDQDRWVALEADQNGLSGADAAAALVAMNAMNRALFTKLSASERATPFSHPEYGALTVDWLIHQMAGHLMHHVPQVEAIAAK
jgi:uncharacterized damage-inducible protein DinB